MTFMLDTITEKDVAISDYAIIVNPDDNVAVLKQGRRLLAFSDSRAEAARLGPRLTLQHEIKQSRPFASASCREGNGVDAGMMALNVP